MGAIAGLGWVVASATRGDLGFAGLVEWFSLPAVVAAAAAVAAGEVVFATVWAVNARGLGGEASVGQGIAAFFASGLARFVPGAVLAYVSRVGFLSDRTVVPGSTAAGLEAALNIAAGVAWGAVAVTAGFAVGVGQWAAVGIAVGVVAASLVGARSVPALVKRFAPNAATERITTGRQAGTFAAYSAGWVPVGASILILAPGDNLALIHAVGAIGIAWLLGLIVVPVPNGLGVREATLVASLGGTIGTDVAAVVALSHRLLWTLVIVVGGIVALPLVRSRR